MDADHISVLFSVLFIWAVVVAIFVLVARRERRTPADDIGVLWLIVFALYATLSPLSWLLQGGSYGLLSNLRLLQLQPSTAEITQLLNIALAYTCGFAVVYIVLRQRVPLTFPRAHTHISSAKMAGALAIVLVFQATMLVVGGGGFIPTPESYVDTYRVIQDLPLAVRQVLKVGGGIASGATLVILIAILQRWPRHRLLFILYLAIVLLSFDPEGSRSAVATGLLSVGIAWHVLVRPVSTFWWLSAGTFALVFFLALGLFRDLGSWVALGALSPDGISLGEFDSLWANAVELLQTRESGGLDVPVAARFGEFWAFVPSQLLPFEKLSLSEWFVETFYPAYKATGGGWAFGAISQAVIGGEAAEAALRGGVLGALAAWIMKWYRAPTATWWRLPLYLYLLVSVFQSVRDTTFRQFSEVVQVVWPALLLVVLTGKLLAQGRNGTRPSEPAACRPSSI